MRVGKKKLWEIVNEIFTRKSALQAGELARSAGISRQAAHRHLAAWVVQGNLRREGKGRGSRYLRPGTEEARFRYRREGLSEDEAWREVSDRVPHLRGVSENVAHILQYAFTELVNNAIDHSAGTWVDVAFPPPAASLAFDVVDDGVGIFEHVRARLQLPDLLSAIQELSKGKITTFPERHTGEGLFFVSKAADFFEIESGGLCWKVDGVRGEDAIADVPPRKGTRARFEVSPAKTRTLAELFSEYTQDYEFSKTRVAIRLFTIGVRFVSRSEAKRLLQGLDRFRDVVLDFQGVREAGQGFCDEVFRVWASAHPAIRLTPVRMAPAVEFMVGRARRAGSPATPPPRS